MSKLKVFSVLLVALSIVSFSQSAKHLCTGFLPENDLQIPISVHQVGGLTQGEFNSVLDEIAKYYEPVVSSKGASLVINREWSSSTVNASAIQYGNTWVLNMYGGLARHPNITADGFQLVACHETGHHLGGAPKLSGWFGDWATNEGGADYFAGIRCLRKTFQEDENAEFVKNNTVDPVLRNQCEMTWNTQAEENLCMRIGMAGENVTALFRTLKNESQIPRFDTPDPAIVSQTDDSHPATQCRMDTYYQSALCVTDVNTELSDSDYHVGTCTSRSHHTVGLRPRCWFMPEENLLPSVAPQASN